jgi:hypothetical protein
MALLIVALFAAVADAGDVEFTLEIHESASSAESISVRPPGMRIANREWAAFGVEQSTAGLLPPKEFDFAAPRQRLRIETVGGRQLQMFDFGPEWLDNEALPLTRELFRLGAWPGLSGTDQQFAFGRCVL